jgi:hypothetical protein
LAHGDAYALDVCYLPSNALALGLLERLSDARRHIPAALERFTRMLVCGWQLCAAKIDLHHGRP